LIERADRVLKKIAWEYEKVISQGRGVRQALSLSLRGDNLRGCRTPRSQRSSSRAAAHAKKDILQLIERADRVLKKIAWEYEK